MASPLSTFLSQPFSTWQSAVIYLILCGALVWVVCFIGSKYMELFRSKPTRRRHQRPLTPYPTRLPQPPFSALSSSANSLRPRSPLSQVTTASSTGSCYDSDSHDLEGHAVGGKRRNVFWPLGIPRIVIGEVSESRIARRRRASSAA